MFNDFTYSIIYFLISILEKENWLLWISILDLFSGQWGPSNQPPMNGRFYEQLTATK